MKDDCKALPAHHVFNRVKTQSREFRNHRTHGVALATHCDLGRCGDCHLCPLWRRGGNEHLPRQLGVGKAKFSTLRKGDHDVGELFLGLLEALGLAKLTSLAKVHDQVGRIVEAKDEVIP